MDFGLCLPNFPAGASGEAIDAAAEAAERLGWSTVWTTDHLLVPYDAADDYGRIYEAILTLAWVGARHDRVRLGTSVIVVPMRNAIVVAKELATLDALTGGRVVAGLGIGWHEGEFANLGVADRYHVRGAYLEETINLFRHLWSGSREPFHGRFHVLDDFVFEPLPDQGANIPIILGGGAPAALARIGRLADGYQSTGTGPDAYARRAGTIRASATAAGRPAPEWQARVRVRFEPAVGEQRYAIRGDPASMAVEIAAWAAIGVSHLALYFDETDPDRLVGLVERFDRDVLPLVATPSAA